jgi:hypothetical protein
MFLMKEEALKFLGEPAGEFMAVVPVGWASRTNASGPQKEPFDVKARYLD